MSEPQKPAERLIRPVKCHFCHGQMFYADEEWYEPEVFVLLLTVDEPKPDPFYAHVRCWNERMGPRNYRDAANEAQRRKNMKLTLKWDGQSGDGKRAFVVAEENDGWKDLRIEVDTDDCDGKHAKKMMQEVIDRCNRANGQ